MGTFLRTVRVLWLLRGEEKSVKQAVARHVLAVVEGDDIKADFALRDLMGAIEHAGRQAKAPGELMDQAVLDGLILLDRRQPPPKFDDDATSRAAIAALEAVMAETKERWRQTTRAARLLEVVYLIADSVPDLPDLFTGAPPAEAVAD